MRISLTDTKRFREMADINKEYNYSILALMIYLEKKYRNKKAQDKIFVGINTINKLDTDVFKIHLRLKNRYLKNDFIFLHIIPSPDMKSFKLKITTYMKNYIRPQFYKKGSTSKSYDVNHVKFSFTTLRKLYLFMVYSEYKFSRLTSYSHDYIYHSLMNFIGEDYKNELL